MHGCLPPAERCDHKQTDVGGLGSWLVLVARLCCKVLSFWRMQIFRIWRWHFIWTAFGFSTMSVSVNENRTGARVRACVWRDRSAFVYPVRCATRDDHPPSYSRIWLIRLVWSDPLSRCQIGRHIADWATFWSCWRPKKIGSGDRTGRILGHFVNDMLRHCNIGRHEFWILFTCIWRFLDEKTGNSVRWRAPDVSSIYNWCATNLTGRHHRSLRMPVTSPFFSRLSPPGVWLIGEILIMYFTVLGGQK